MRRGMDAARGGGSTGTRMRFAPTVFAVSMTLAICARVPGAGGVGLEATLIAVDNSGYMINSDHRPSRLQSQYECVNLVCTVKTQNPENTIGLLTMGCRSDEDCPRVHITPATNQQTGPIIIAMVVHTRSITPSHTHMYTHNLF